MFVFTLSTSRPGLIRTEAAWRLYGNRAILVQYPCSFRSFCMKIVLSPCRGCAIEGAVTVQPPCRF